MTEKLFTGTLNKNQNAEKFASRIDTVLETGSSRPKSTWSGQVSDCQAMQKVRKKRKGAHERERERGRERERYACFSFLAVCVGI